MFGRACRPAIQAHHSGCVDCRQLAIREPTKAADLLCRVTPQMPGAVLFLYLPDLRFHPRVEYWGFSPVIFSHGNWTTYGKMVIMTPSG